jgi:hypothetical protein
MHRTVPVLVKAVRHALTMSQNDLAKALGWSRRTGQRWAKHGGPSSMVVQDMARLVFPVDAQLAAEVALAGGSSLEALGLVRPAPPALPPPRPVLPERVVDAVVCAAAEAMQVTPQQARPAVLAAFSCAQELGLVVEDVTRVLRKAPRPVVAEVRSGA